MPGTDRVQVYKVETDTSDLDPFGGPTAIDPQEDAIESAGHYFQDASNRDEDVYADRNGDDLRFRDLNNTTPLTLSDLLSGGGAHAALRQLIHLADGVGGPFEQFLSGAYREISGGAFPTSKIWYESSAKTKKIVEKTITRNPNQTPATIEWKAYATDGSTVIATVTDTITYSGVFETSRTRTIA